MTSLPNYAVCQIDHSRNNAIFPSNSRFHALKYVESRHHAFPLGGPIEGGILMAEREKFSTKQKIKKDIMRTETLMQGGDVKLMFIFHAPLY